MASNLLEAQSPVSIRQYINKLGEWLNPFAHRHAYELAVKDLPPQLSRLYGGNIYGVVASPSAVLNSCLFHTLLRERDRPAAFISTLAEQDVMSLLTTYGVDLSIEDPDLQIYVFQFSEDFKTQFDVWGLENFLRELESYQLPEHSLIIIQHADYLFNHEDRLVLKLQGETLQKWFEDHMHCGILVFPTESWQETKHMAGNLRNNFPLRLLKTRLSGLVRLIDQAGNFIWRFEFWETKKNLVGSQTYDLQFDQEGYLHALQPLVSTDEISLAPDEMRVVVCNKALKGERNIPTHWEVESDNDEVLKVCHHAIAATILLSFDGTRSLEELAHIVHQLRQTCGNAVKIAVREQNEVMRHQHGRLMLDLGVNLVIGKGVPLTQIVSMLDSLQGQVFSKPLIEDFRNALAIVSAPSFSGYMPVYDFIRAVRSTVRQSQSLNVPNVLIKLQVRSHVSHVEALQVCSNLKRLGDLCTIDQQWLYVFLFECRSIDVDIVKDRIFTLPAGQFFEAEFRFEDNNEILEQLNVFKDELNLRPTTDYRAALQQIKQGYNVGLAKTPSIETPTKLISTPEVSIQETKENQVATLLTPAPFDKRSELPKTPETLAIPEINFSEVKPATQAQAFELPLRK